MSTKENDWMRDASRRLAALEISAARTPVRLGKVRPPNTGNVIYAQVVGAVASGDPTGTFDNATGPFVGSIPTGGTGTFQNVNGETFTDNQWVKFFQRKDNSQWLPERGGTAGSQVIYFELTENKSFGDSSKLAKPVLADGSLDTGAPAFHVVDDQNQFYGKIGYRGFAVRYTDDFLEGVPGFRIITMQGPAHFMVVALSSAYSTGGTDCTPVSSPIYGKPFRGERLPDTGDVTVVDDLLVAPAAQIGELWLISFDEIEEHYIFIVPLTRGTHYLLRFETTAAKDWNASTVAGVILDASDTPAGGAITLTDRAPAKHEAQIGSRGWCLLVGSIEDGFTFWIVTMDSPARWVEGALNADWALSSDSAVMTKDDWWGASPNHLEPVDSTITIWDILKVRSRKYFSGEKFRALWDEKRKKFYVANPPGDYITIKGTTGAVTRATPTFTLSEPVAVNGQLPTGTITVTNDPPINTPGGRTIYARFNFSIGTDLQTAWDTGDGGNFLHHLRGLLDGGTEVRMVVDWHTASGEGSTDDPHWHKVAACTPPA